MSPPMLDLSVSQFTPFLTYFLFSPSLSFPYDLCPLFPPIPKLSSASTLLPLGSVLGEPITVSATWGTEVLL